MCKELKLKIIDCVNYCYISDGRDGYRSSSSLEQYLYDGEKPEKTNKDAWYKLSKIPSKIQIMLRDEYVNKRYELKKGYKPNGLMPKTISYDDYGRDEYEDIRGLYKLVYDIKPGVLTDIPFEISTIFKKEDMKLVENKYDAESDLLTQIEEPEILYQEHSCVVTSAKMFKIIREYVKKNIDTDAAIITTDCDSRFLVKKKILLFEPEAISYNENSGTRRKPKWVTKSIKTKSVEVLDIAPYGRGLGISVPHQIVGNNYEDCNRKVDEYLKKLIKEINSKWCECPRCKGFGILEDVENEN